MSRKISDYKKVLKILEELHTKYPNYNLGRHLSTALSDYGDPWSISDKELAFALNKYSEAMALDLPEMVDDAYVQKIIKDSENFDDLLNQEDGY